MHCSQQLRIFFQEGMAKGRLVFCGQVYCLAYSAFPVAAGDIPFNDRGTELPGSKTKDQHLHRDHPECSKMSRSEDKFKEIGAYMAGKAAKTAFSKAPVVKKTVTDTVKKSGKSAKKAAATVKKAAAKSKKKPAGPTGRNPKRRTAGSAGRSARPVKRTKK